MNERTKEEKTFNDFIEKVTPVNKKVICIKNSLVHRELIDGDHLVTKGRVYTVIEEIETPSFNCKDETTGEITTRWYKLQETDDNVHADFLFKEYTDLNQLSEFQEN